MSIARDILLERMCAHNNLSSDRGVGAPRLSKAHGNSIAVNEHHGLARKMPTSKKVPHSEIKLFREVSDNKVSAADASVSNTVAEKWWRLLCRPWSFVWRLVLVFGAIGCLVLRMFAGENPELHLVYAMVMAAYFPSVMCVFFAELAQRMGLKWNWILMAYIVGGIASIFMTMYVNALDFLPSEASWAGVIEEPCKGIVLFFIMVAFPKVIGILSGLALGAAVGAGFATIETFFYAYNYGSGGFPSTFVLVYRGVLSPMMHTGWSAALGGALWYIRYPDRFALSARRYLWVAVVFMLMIICHCVWNGSNAIGFLPIVVWVLIFYYAKMGTSEMRIAGKEWPV